MLGENREIDVNLSAEKMSPGEKGRERAVWRKERVMACKMKENIKDISESRD